MGLGLDHLGLQGLGPLKSIRGAGDQKRAAIQQAFQSYQVGIHLLLLAQSQKQVDSTYR